MTGAGTLNRAARIAGDRAGTAVIEFAVLFPVLLTLFLGSFETSHLLLAYLKLEAAAETAADLVAQTSPNTVLQSSDFTNITNAVDQVMTPLSTTGLEVAYASVTYSTGSPVIDWHVEVNGAAPITVSSLPDGVNAATLGSETQGSLDSVIVVRLTFPYVSPVHYIFGANFTLSEAAFNRPRYVDCVPTYLNTGNICP